MSVNTTIYKGITVIDGLPLGVGGQIIQQGVMSLADRIGPTHKATTSPTALNDSADTAGIGVRFEVNSRWIKTTGGQEEEFVCLANTPGGAVWKSTTSGGGAGGDVSNKADKVVGAGAGNIAGLDSGGNLIDLGVAPSSFSVSGHNHDDRYFTESEVNTLLNSKVNTSTTITTSGALTGGGNLSGNLTLSVSSANSEFGGIMSSFHYNLLEASTSNNTPSTLVKRDVDGDFDARDITGRNIIASSITNNISTQKVEISKNGTLSGTRKRINFIEGSGTTITIADNSANDRVDVTVHNNASVGGGISVVNTGTVGTGLYVGPGIVDPSSHHFANLYSPDGSISIGFQLSTATVNLAIREIDFDYVQLQGALPTYAGGTGSNLGGGSGPLRLNDGVFEVGQIDPETEIANFYDEVRMGVLDIITSSSTVTKTTSPTSPFWTMFEVPDGSSIQKVNLQQNGNLVIDQSTLNFIDDPAGTTMATIGYDGNYGINFAVVEDSHVQRTDVYTDYTFRGSRRSINFVAGDSISLVAADDPFTNEVRVTINATGSASGESNTGSNLGSGVGVYSTKVGADLRFKSLSATSSRITIVNDGANGEIDFDVPENTANQKVQIAKAGTLIGTRRKINFHEGASITITVADDAVNDEVDVTIAATGSATGEVNTGSNIGTGGVGVYHSKSGSDLRFKKLNVGSNKVTIVDDGVNSEIDFDVNEANLNHNNIGGILGLSKGGTNANLSATGGAGQYLKQTTAGAAITVGVIAAADIPTGVDAIKIGTGLVSNTEFGYLDGVTSPIQTQLNGKAASIHPHVSGDISNFTEAVQDVIGGLFVDSTHFDYTYDDTANTFSATIKNNISTQKVELAKNGVLVGTRKRINLIEGTNVTLTIADDALADEVDVTINSTGSGGGSVSTGSNVNSGGIGVFKQLAGANLEFRGINSTNNRISVSLDAANNEIDLTFNDSNVDINNLANTLALYKGGTGTDLTLTGGSNHFVKQSGLGAPLSVGPIVSGDIPNNISTQKVEVSWNSSAVVGARKKINFIEGGNATIIVGDDPANDRINVTIAGVGGMSESDSTSLNEPNTIVRRDNSGNFSANIPSFISLQILDSINSSSGESYAPLTLQDITHGGGDLVRITPTMLSSGPVLALRPTYDQTGHPPGAGTEALLISRTNIYLNPDEEVRHFYIRCLDDGVENFSVDNWGVVTAAGITSNISTQRVEVANNGTLVGARKRLNFIPGTNVSYTMANNVANDRIDITINSTGGGGGGGNLDDLGDVVITSPATGHVLQHNGTNFINRTLADAGISAVGHTHLSANITDATSANTANMIVKRGASGEIATGTHIGTKSILGTVSPLIGRNVAEFRITTSSNTGAIIIKAPFGFNNRMQTWEIDGYRYTTDSGFRIRASFYNFTTTPAFHNFSHTFDGAGQIQVRLAREISTGNICMILGDTATVWQFPNIVVNAFLGHTNPTTSLFEGWSVQGSVTDISGYDMVTDVPRVGTFNSSSGYVGVGVNPSFPLHVESSQSGLSTMLKIRNTSSGVNTTLNIDASTGRQGSINFSEAGASKWQLGRNTDNSFFLYDAVNTANIYAVDTSSNIAFGTATTTLVGIGAINSSAKLNVGFTDSGSAARYGVRIAPTYQQTGAGSSVDLLINRTETSLGSGTHYFMLAQVGSNTRFSVTNAGVAAASRFVGTPSADGDAGLSIFRSGETSSRWSALGNGANIWSDGSTIDLRLRRSGTKTLTLDDNAAGAANLAVTGNITVANRSVTKKYSALIGDGSATVYTITQATHGLASDDTNTARVSEVSTGNQIIVPISYASNGDVVITFPSAPASNSYKVVIIG